MGSKFVTTLLAQWAVSMPMGDKLNIDLIDLLVGFTLIFLLKQIEGNARRNKHTHPGRSGKR